MYSGFNRLALSGHIMHKILLIPNQHHLCPTINLPTVPIPCKAIPLWDLMANPTCFMALGATVWSMIVKGMDFLMPNILHIWALVRIHPAARIGMPIQSDYPLVRVTGSMGNLLN